MTRDLSDWDPLPAEETGLHPGEAQKFLRAAEPRPAPPTDAFAVVRSTMPASGKRGVNAQQGARPAASAPSALPVPVPPSLPVLAAPQLARAEAEAPSVAVAVVNAPMPPIVSHVSSPRRESRPTASRSQQPDVLGAMARPSDAMRPMPAALMATTPVSARKPLPKPVEPQQQKAAEKAQPASRAFFLAPAPAESGLDPRAREPWFLSMPVVEQLRLSRAWQQDRDAALLAAAQQAPRSQRMLERFWVAYVVFFVAALPLMLTEGLMGFVRMAMAGCVTGLLWQIVPHTRRACAVSAVSAYAAVAMLPRIGELSAAPFALLNSLGGAALVYYLAGLGAAHEDRADALADHTD